MNSLDLYKFWNKEIQPNIKDAYINDAALTEKGYALELFTKEGKRILYLDVPEYPFFYNQIINKKRNDEIVSFLEKTIGKKILDSKIFGLNRTIVILLPTIKIFAEFYNPGIIVITDNENMILSANNYKNFGKRKIEKGQTYNTIEIPIIQNYEEFSQKIKNSKKNTIVTALAIDLNLGGIYANEICRRSNIDTATPISNLNENNLDNLYKIYRQLIEEYIPSVCNDEITTIKCNEKQFDSVNAAILEKELTANKQKDKTDNNIIQLQIQTIQNNIDKIFEAQKILLDKNLSFSERVKQIKDLGIELSNDKFIIDNVSIGIKQNPYDLINALYEKLKRIKTKYKKEEQNIKEAKLYFENKWYARFLYSFSKNNKLIVWGKDQTQNNLLINKYLDSKDNVFHADIMGAPFVILKGEPNEEEIEEAATIAASYSSAWKEQISNVKVFYVKGEQVSKSPPSGEFLKKGAFYIKGSRNYITAVNQIYLGIDKISDGLLKILPYAHETQHFFLIQPGRKRNTEEIVKTIAKKMKYRIQKDNIDRLLPPGGFLIKKVKI